MRLWKHCLQTARTTQESVLGRYHISYLHLEVGVKLLLIHDPDPLVNDVWRPIPGPVCPSPKRAMVYAI